MFFKISKLLKHLKSYTCNVLKLGIYITEHLYTHRSVLNYCFIIE